MQSYFILLDQPVLQIMYLITNLWTNFKPLIHESYQVLHVDYPVTVQILTYREARIRCEVVIFCFAKLVSFLGPGTAVATAALPGLLRKGDPHPYLFRTKLRMPGWLLGRPTRTRICEA